MIGDTGEIDLVLFYFWIYRREEAKTLSTFRWYERCNDSAGEGAEGEQKAKRVTQPMTMLTMIENVDEDPVGLNILIWAS
jgi:hypothetical protein